MDIACYKYHNQGPHLNAGGITIVLTGSGFIGGEGIEIVIVFLLESLPGGIGINMMRKNPLELFVKSPDF